MNDIQVESLREQFSWYETDELLKIWQTHDPKQWTKEAYEAIRQVLITRVEELPPYEDREAAEISLEEARAFYENFEFEKALAICDQVIQTVPNYSEGHYLKGVILDEMDRLEEAIVSLQMAVQLDPGSSTARKCLRSVKDELMQKSVRTEDRILAAMSHGSVIASPYGIVVPAIIWIFERKKSKFLAYQCLQALVLQALNFLLQVGGIFMFLILVISSSALNARQPVYSDFLAWSFIGAMSLAFCPTILLFLYGLVGSINVLLGKNFHYAVIGNLVTRYYKEVDISQDTVASS